MTGSDTASRARSLMTDLGEKPVEVEVTTGVPINGLVGPSPKVSVLPPRGELPTCFEVKARILDFYPITLDEEDCLLPVCGDCENLSVSCVISFAPTCLTLPQRIERSAESCLSCSSMTYQAPVTFRFSLLFMLGTEDGEEFVVAAGNIDVSRSSKNRLQQ